MKVPDFHRARPTGHVHDGQSFAAICQKAWRDLGHKDVIVNSNGGFVYSNLVNGLPPSFFKDLAMRKALERSRSLEKQKLVE